MAEGYKYSYGKNYLHLDIPVQGVLDEEGKLLTEIKRNQHVFIQAAATVDVRGNSFLEVEPNSELAEHGQVQGIVRIHPGSGKKQLGFWYTARKDTNLQDLTYAVRLYLPV